MYGRTCLPGTLGSSPRLRVSSAVMDPVEERLKPRCGLGCARLGEWSAWTCAICRSAVLERRGMHGHLELHSPHFEERS